MAVTTTIDNNSVTIKLNNGLKPDGTVLTVNLNVSGIKKTAFSEDDKQKLLNIVTALRPLLSLPVLETSITTKQIIAEGA